LRVGGFARINSTVRHLVEKENAPRFSQEFKMAAAFKVNQMSNESLNARRNSYFLKNVVR